MDLQQVAAIVGTPVGIWLGQQLGAKAEAKRWLREWQVTQIQERRAYMAEICIAMDALIVVHELDRRAQQRNDPPVSHDRVGEATRAWRSVLARRYVYAHASLQHALVRFDMAREASVEAINDHDDQRLTEAAKMLDLARLGTLDAVQEFVNSAQQTVATHVSAALPWWTLQHWRLQPPVAPMPSAMAEANRDAQATSTTTL